MQNASLVRAAIAAAVLCAMPAIGQSPLPDRTLPEEAGPELSSALELTVGGVNYRVPYSVGTGDDAASPEDDEALYQGDILLGPLAAVQSVPAGTELQMLTEEILFGLAVRNLDARWPDGVMRYRISPDLAQPERVANAIAAWEAATDAVSFDQIAGTDGDYVEFVTGTGCSSAVGKAGGRQVIRLAPGCDTGNTIHEIGHALGLHHEQAREDRGSHAIIFTANILAGREGNFLQDPTSFEDIGLYCHGSIMHYGAYAFSVQPGVLKTIETVPPGIPIGQRAGLAPCDVETIEIIYEAVSDPIPANFEGVIDLFPAGCQADRKCFLRNDLKFTDPRNIVWMAGHWVDGSPVTVETGITDGASIPDWAIPIIGDPYSDEYLRAAILHDHYCYKENHVRGWRQTHRMFYDAMKAMDVPWPKAEIMYAAVLAGGPKWLKIVPGENCGPNCIMDGAAGNAAIDDPDGESELKRAATFGDPEFTADLAVFEQAIVADPDITPDEIVALVQSERPEDFFFAYPDRYVAAGPDDPVFSAR